VIHKKPEHDPEAIKQAIEETFHDLLLQVREIAKQDPDSTFSQFLPFIKGLRPKDAVTKLEKMATLRRIRMVVYDQLALFMSNEELSRILKLCQEAPMYVAGDYDKGALNNKIKLYEEAKKRIKRYVEKQNNLLVDKDPFFGLFPIGVRVSPHHLDTPYPPKQQHLGKGKAMLIKQLSDILSPYMPDTGDRSEFIGIILRSFAGLPRAETPANSIREHF
jgi:hypothetical protein